MPNRIIRITFASTIIAPMFMTYGWIVYWNSDRTTALILFVACAALACTSLGRLRFARKNLECTRKASSILSLPEDISGTSVK